MKNGPTYFKYSVVLICVIAIIMLFRGCFSDTKTKVKPVVFTKTETKYIPVKSTSHFVPVPYKVTYHDTLETEGQIVYVPSFDSLPSNVREMLKNYNSTKYYSDTTEIKYGKIVSNDTVRWNKIIGSGIETDLLIPETTVTKTVEATPRVTAFIGFSAIANQTSWLATSADFSIQAKNKKIYSIGAALSKGGDIYYSAGFKIPIRLKKRGQ